MESKQLPSRIRSLNIFESLTVTRGTDIPRKGWKQWERWNTHYCRVKINLTGCKLCSLPLCNLCCQTASLTFPNPNKESLMLILIWLEKNKGAGGLSGTFAMLGSLQIMERPAWGSPADWSQWENPFPPPNFSGFNTFMCFPLCVWVLLPRPSCPQTLLACKNTWTWSGVK